MTAGSAEKSSGVDPPVESRHLRSAIEFAVEVARIGQRQRPPVPVPEDLRPMLTQARIPTGALGRARRCIEEAPDFRRALAHAATPELVDEVGRLWLDAADGWGARAAAVIADKARDAEERAQANAARKERRRREAAEQVAVRSRTELAALRARIEELEVALESEVEARLRQEHESATLRERLAGEQLAARHARDREGAARAEAERLREALASATGERRAVETARDVALADRAALREQEARLREAAATAQRLVAHLNDLLPDPNLVTGGAQVGGAVDDEGSGSVARRPLTLPGGVAGDSDLAVEHLMRSSALVIVDGYNLTMSMWPGAELVTQRQRLVDVLEESARRAGTEFVIVFDGADVVGGHGARRLVRVVYSPEGVIADDVIRAEVRRVPASRPVVVVTDDAEIRRDVRRLGANTVRSAALYRWCQR